MGFFEFFWKSLKVFFSKMFLKIVSDKLVEMCNKFYIFSSCLKMISNWDFLMIFCFRERWMCLLSHIIIFQIRRNFWTRRKFCQMTRKSWKIAKNSQKTLWFWHPTEHSTVPELFTDLKNYSMRKWTKSQLEVILRLIKKM